MRRVEAILPAGLFIPLAGCVVGGKTPATPPAPPAPQPVAKATPPPPPPPLSMPQTQITLPPPQPVNMEAVNAISATAPPAETIPAPKPPRRPPATPAQPARTETPPAATPTQPAETDHPPLQELVPPDEQKRLQEEADGRKREIKQILDAVKARGRLNTTQRTMVRRVESFVGQSDEAAAKGDMKLANALADRALVMARELQNGK